MSTNCDLVSAMASVLNGRGHAVDVRDDSLNDPTSGFVFRPHLVEIQPLRNGVHTVTVVEVYHPQLVAAGTFEYQHATGDNTEASIVDGFEQWANLDFVPLLDALRPKAESCLTLDMTSLAKDGRSRRRRRVVLGPVAQFMAQPPQSPPISSTADSAAQGEQEHCFCACCLFTRSGEAFQQLIDDDGFYGIRLYAMRAVDGAPQADCRVNGHDFEPGAAALREYVKTWPAAGFEFRKQYVVLHSIPLEAGEGTDAQDAAAAREFDPSTTAGNGP